ncbi:MAG: beta-N-acetylhexosaminidase [Bacteroidaceae bacterium]|nr:beta-N-acetylhexosaminidase [Bacteroidaceae bacterium]
MENIFNLKIMLMKTMKKTVYGVLMAMIVGMVLGSCGKKMVCETIEIVPKPQQVTLQEGRCKVNPLRLEDKIRYKADQSLGEEAYVLEVAPKGITITSSTPAGAFYALQSLKQMVPAEAVADRNVRCVELPCCTIEDAPAFAYRGAHLDVCRHFFSVNEVKEYLDILAFNKINRFHFHLTEDQGWRIEIKAYPKLTEVGAWRKGTMVGKNWNQTDSVRYGGFYTQDEIRDIVQYASERFITVVPEIEIPGHALAALASYPELGCRGEGYEVSPFWGVFPEVFCPGKEETFTFWETVLTEVMDLFPSEYIHIGGDECPKQEWEKCPLCQKRMKEEGCANEFELQSYVTRRVEAFLNAHGRQIIGWDEILEGGVTPTATIMSWRGTDGGIAAAQKGNKVIMTPNSYCYLDYYQSRDTEHEPLAIGGYLPTEKVYSFNPYAGLTEEQQQYILGVQGNVWTEYIQTFDQVEYMLLPRLCAIAETAWTLNGRDYDDFVKRMQHMRTYFDANGWNYAKHIFE